MARHWLPMTADLKLLGGNKNFESISGMQFLHQDRHIVLDRLLPYAKPHGNFAIGKPSQ